MLVQSAALVAMLASRIAMDGPGTSMALCELFEAANTAQSSCFVFFLTLRFSTPKDNAKSQKLEIDTNPTEKF